MEEKDCGDLDAHKAAYGEKMKAVDAALAEQKQKTDEHDKLVRQPWWKAWPFFVGFISILVGVGIFIGTTPSRADMDAHKSDTEKKVAEIREKTEGRFTKVWEGLGSVNNSVARTETEIKNVQKLMERMDQKLDQLFQSRR